MAAMSKSQGSKKVGVLLVAGSIAVLVGGKMWSMKMKAVQNEQEEFRRQGILTPRQRKPPSPPAEAKAKVLFN